MTAGLTCQDCGNVLNAETEAELVYLGQEHAGEHGHSKSLPRKQV